MPAGPMRIGTFTLDPVRGRLLDERGVQRPLRPKAFALLHCMAQRADQLLSRSDLTDCVWPNLFVSDDSLTQLVREVRRALDDPGGKRLQTVPGRGYMLTGVGSRPEPVAPPVPVLSPGLPASSFVGRTAELAALHQQTARNRLVTITGPGGVGKTRLMLHFAATLSGAGDERRVRLDLAPLTHARDLIGFVAAALGVGGVVDDDLAPILAVLSRPHMLLIDNAEHLVRPLGALLQTALAACPALRALVTSRVALAIPEESVLRLEPLSLPSPSCPTTAEALRSDAVRLFADRAAMQVPGFDIVNEDPGVIGAICRKLDGLALAIEMAIPRLQVLTPQQLLDRLDQRLRLQAPLAAGTSGRQSSMNAVLQWSWELLQPDERSLLQSVAVFAGDAPLSALVAMHGGDEWAVLDALSALARASMIQAVPGAPEPRYGVLETTRAFALAQLSAEAERLLRDQHLDQVLARFEAAEREWPTTPSADWLRRYGPDANNLRAGLHWSFRAEGDRAAALQLISVSYPLWLELDTLPLREGRHWYGLGVAAIGPDTPQAVQAKLFLGRSWPDDQLGDLATLQWAERAAALFRELDDSIGLGAALWRAGCAVLLPGSLDRAAAYLEAAERALRTQPLTKWLVLTMTRRASTWVQQLKTEQAHRLFAEALGMARALGYPYGAMLCGHSMGDNLFAMGRRDDALALLIALRQELPRGLRSQLVSNLATQLAAEGRTTEALDAIAETLEATPVTGLSATLARSVETVAMLAAEAGQPELGAQLLGYVLTVHSTQRTRNGGRLIVYQRLLAALDRAGITGERRDALLQAGAGWSEARVVDLAGQTVARLAT